MADTSSNVNKVFGAIGLSGVSGALTEIKSDTIIVGDIGFVVANGIFYIYRCVEDGATVRSPYVLKPADSETTNKRWKLASMNTLTSDVVQSVGKYFQTSEIRANSTLSITDVDGNEIARIGQDGKMWISELALGSSEVVMNLNADMVDGIDGDELVLRDGSKSFMAPVSGYEPTAPAHLATKNYVDGRVAMIDSAQYMRKDGTTAFVAPVPGVTPTYDYHLTTKAYVDESISETLEEIRDNQAVITYKNGTTAVQAGSTETTVVFGSTLQHYTISVALINTVDEDPSLFQYVISDKTPTSFTVKFGGEIDSSNFSIDWMVTGFE